MNRYTEESIQICIDNSVDPKICEELRDYKIAYENVMTANKMLEKEIEKTTA